MKKQLHFNKPQLRSMMIAAPTEYLVAGRGTGKSEGVLAPKSANCYFNTMPRGTGVAVGATYAQLLTRTLPALIAGWERIGYVMGRHYLIGKKPTEKWIKQWGWKGPYRPPLDFKYFISWWNGAGAHLVSQDRTGSSNGITIDWIIGDEAKLLNQDKLKTELFPANRGIIKAFENNPYHHGMTFTTDMPVGASGRWILDMMDQMDKKTVNEIWELQTIKFQLKALLGKANKGVSAEIIKQLTVIDAELNDKRKGLLFYHEASTLDNIHALGLDYIKQQLRDTSLFQFDTQILNLRPLKLEDGFYPDFDEEYHGYFAEHASYFDNIEFQNKLVLDCRKDKDLDPNKPLHIAIDYNRRIHPIVVGQDTGEVIKTLNGIHALYPGKLKEALDLFIEYYKYHKRKLIYYWYDHTAIGGENETEKYSDVTTALRKAGWVVMPMYIGKAPGHEAKYRMWGHLLQEHGKYNRKFRINRENCNKVIISVCMAQAEQRKDGFGKDKKSEHNPNFPADESTHYSDALDMMVYGILESDLPYGVDSKGGGGMIL
jgi:hypothetical protein